VAYLDEDLLKRLLDEQPATPVDTPAATTTPPADAQRANQSATAAPADSDDKQANALPALANSYIAANLPDKGKGELTQFLEKYPNSAAGHGISHPKDPRPPDPFEFRERIEEGPLNMNWGNFARWS
jgi:hypothetical protein